LTDPSVDKAPYQLFFTAEAPADWELSGFYAAAASLQDLVSVRGAPVHLHGFQRDRARAGHIGSAIPEGAEIRLYPLAAPTVRDADLTLRSVQAGRGQVTFEVLNTGNQRVARTTVQGIVSGRVVFQLELFDLNRGVPRPVTAMLPAGTEAGELEIVVDPFNDVLESDEGNNYYFQAAPRN
jgi:CARDB